MKLIVKKEGNFLYPVKDVGKFKNLPNAQYIIEINSEKKRTNPQNRAIHLFCEWVSFELNNAGLNRKLKLPNIGVVNVLWTKDSVKEGVWKPIQKALLDKESTSDLSSKEVTEVYDQINLWLSEKGISVPFPTEENDV
jgi:hypothetical protein